MAELLLLCLVFLLSVEVEGGLRKLGGGFKPFLLNVNGVFIAEKNEVCWVFFLVVASLESMSKRFLSPIISISSVFLLAVIQSVYDFGLIIGESL